MAENSADTSAWFWQVVAQTNGDEEHLEKLLLAMSKEQLREFYRHFQQYAADLKTDRHLRYLRAGLRIQWLIFANG